ncbi:unnamed protein product [Rotaria sp. Silwood2]|nr:unnamed protein product [Rotaria sp. Silwood2]CAF3218108.1 unnamed protein product [Rotaria sp. Silwood2]CAF3349958.1 unnamed protein product [Rotaria sp. Silwood2]CAF3405328.1 unnamed protein product [Rotaria sp. Silwood2]CAF4443386.1 unnamed protein product [Rotaria sp. Silwood2]
MLLNATVQHRVKHYDLLLARELASIEREHEQNLITHKNLENSIRRETYRKKSTLPFDEIYHEQNQTLDYHKINISTNNYLNDKSSSSVVSSIQNESQIDETILQISSRHQRQCSKLQRLPPIIKASLLNRSKQSTNNSHWMDHFRPLNKRKESFNDTLLELNEQLSKATLPRITPIEKQINSFMESLPTYTGIQRGFDNFAPSSLYSSRPPVIMK